MVVIAIWIIGAIAHSAWINKNQPKKADAAYFIGFLVGLLWPIYVAVHLTIWVMKKHEEYNSDK